MTIPLRPRQHICTREQTSLPRQLRKRMVRWYSCFVDEQQASALIEFAFMLPVLTLLLAGGIDFGRAWYVNLEVASAAEAGALYGVQSFGDIAGMKAAAQLDGADLPSLQSTATYGSECSDGTSATALASTVASCTFNSIQYVEVDTTATYKPLLLIPGVASQYTLTAKSRMRTQS